MRALSFSPRPLGLALAAALLLLTAPDADAQRRGRYRDYGRRYDERSNTRGLLLEATVNGTALSIEGDEAGAGVGVGARVGYGLNDFLSLFVGLNVAAMEDRGDFFEEISSEDQFGYGSLDLGLELNFGAPRSALVPYIQAAVSGAGIVIEESRDVDRVLGGGALSGAIGLKYFAVPTLALNVGVGGTVGRFTQEQILFDGEEVEDVEIEEDFSAGRVHVGLSFYPLR